MRRIRSAGPAPSSAQGRREAPERTLVWTAVAGIAAVALATALLALVGALIAAAVAMAY